ncbi:hypothetical protein BO70DRAFT_390357 [Aspergillus heteromorphus CBS 117.55]|uniref:Protein kinase domain-containing protein n=1 Tax=Aspergillus heteromorphus CBS 117.55 TaxID=1448321 RepID=A0A317V2D7_9EURO|nr:uncharacterized protein BO70DRAFT_390357 [Aspergillus heteromorphus CBS 117.55]PWY68464.1 hypothetical protein BO70DRAFT_390357 [Aspergillus heteromorphus CBS 117.55]
MAQPIPDIQFKKLLSSSPFSVIYLVSRDDAPMVMKVHHDYWPDPFASRNRENNIFVCESQAYRRLEAKGLCDRGIVPRFYGTLEKIDPTLHQPYLDMFLQDELAPNAMLTFENYTKDSMEWLIKGIADIHDALIEHGDPHPRNMMVVGGSPGRAGWIDFGRAQTFDTLTPLNREWMESERRLVDEIGRDMMIPPAKAKATTTPDSLHYCVDIHS